MDINFFEYSPSIRNHPFIAEIINKALLSPVEDLINRRGKGFRGELVELSFKLSHQHFTDTNDGETKRRQLSYSAQLIEGLHAGSIIIDDIEDGSPIRRGEPAIHIKYGTGIAINVGNWLYFWALQQIAVLQLSEKQELQMHRLVHEILFQAHIGQAIDIGTPITSIPKQTVLEICSQSIELKSGALVELAFGVGAIIADANEKKFHTLRAIGKCFGVALQRFDDTRNLKNGYINPSNEPIARKYEDLFLKRPTWIWQYLSENVDDQTYNRFLSAVGKLPDDSFLRFILGELNLLENAKTKAFENLKNAICTLEADKSTNEFSQTAIDELAKFADKLKRAYD